MITGVFDPWYGPAVRGKVFVPRLARGGEVWFRVDTGADFTCLHPNDSGALRIPFDLLDADRSFIGYGVGGGNTFFIESAQLVFDDDDWGFEVRTIGLRIAAPNPANASLPSLLGLDILNHWRMNFDPRNGLLQFFP